MGRGYAPRPPPQSAVHIAYTQLCPIYTCTNCHSFSPLSPFLQSLDPPLSRTVCRSPKGSCTYARTIQAHFSKYLLTRSVNALRGYNGELITERHTYAVTHDFYPGLPHIHTYFRLRCCTIIVHGMVYFQTPEFKGLSMIATMPDHQSDKTMQVLG